MIAAIILAGGRGTRMNSHAVNKVTLPFLGKPIIRYAVELVEGMAHPIVVVVGAHKQSVIEAIGRDDILYAYQEEQLGTAHAVKVGLELLEFQKPKQVLVGYGDHMMFYKKQTIKNLIDTHLHQKAAISFFTTRYKDPHELAWAHIIRDKNDNVTDIVEHKDASEEIKTINELNPGFYCFDYDYLAKTIQDIKKSPVTHEYYLTDIFKLAFAQNKKVVGVLVPFEQVGIGINKAEELHMSQQLYKVVTGAE